MANNPIIMAENLTKAELDVTVSLEGVVATVVLQTPASTDLPVSQVKQAPEPLHVLQLLVVKQHDPAT